MAAAVCTCIRAWVFARKDLNVMGVSAFLQCQSVCYLRLMKERHVWMVRGMSGFKPDDAVLSDRDEISVAVRTPICMGLKTNKTTKRREDRPTCGQAHTSQTQGSHLQLVLDPVQVGRKT